MKKYLPKLFVALLLSTTPGLFAIKTVESERKPKKVLRKEEIKVDLGSEGRKFSRAVKGHNLGQIIKNIDFVHDVMERHRLNKKERAAFTDRMRKQIGRDITYNKDYFFKDSAALLNVIFSEDRYRVRGYDDKETISARMTAREIVSFYHVAKKMLSGDKRSMHLDSLPKIVREELSAMNVHIDSKSYDNLYSRYSNEEIKSDEPSFFWKSVKFMGIFTAISAALYATLNSKHVFPMDGTGWFSSEKKKAKTA
jgi:hypothetical protein